MRISDWSSDVCSSDLTYVESRWMELGANARFVQDNHSYSRPQGTIRGIHFQSPPHAQAKLIRCVRGRIMDYAVDLRRSSPTFGHHVSAELTAETCCPKVGELRP